MNFNPGNRSRLSVCHLRSAGFLEFLPTMGLSTTASLKWSTTAAIAKTPPRRSYRLFSGSGAARTDVARRAAASVIAIAHDATKERRAFMIVSLCAVL